MSYCQIPIVTSCLPNYYNQHYLNYNNLYNASVSINSNSYIKDIYKCSYCLRETESKTDNCKGCGAYSYLTIKR